MARVAVCLALIAPAAGLVAPAAPAASTALKAEAAASLKGMSGGVQAGDPMPGEGPWDPIGFSKLHENIQGSEHAGVVPSQQWMREAEIKHGRVRCGVRLPSHLDGAKPHAINAPSPQVAMLAFTGALVQSYGMHFDGKLNGMFYEKGVNPFEVGYQCLS